MQAWDKRPFEVAHLLNPAYCSVLLRSACAGYHSVISAGMPFEAAFLVLPTVLHRRTKSSLPKTSATKLHVWLQAHGEVLLGFRERVISLNPYTREALTFGLTAGVIQIDASGCLFSGQVHSPSSLAAKALKGDTQSATIVGKLFAKAGALEDLFTVLGVGP